jgi:alpha-beta hydrolase superfamily lysophospholipase
VKPPALHRYGADPAQFGELWLPSQPSRGTVVIIHGGFWRARYDLSLGSPLAADLAARGYTAWNLEYRRAGAGGGYVAVTGVVAQAGVLALADCAREGVGGSAAPDLMGGGPDELPREYRLADPIAAVPAPVPVLCLHSRGDANVPIAYSERYVAAATAAGGQASLVELSGDHFTLIDPAAPDWAAVLAALPWLLAERPARLPPRGAARRADRVP